MNLKFKDKAVVKEHLIVYLIYSHETFAGFTTYSRTAYKENSIKNY